MKTKTGKYHFKLNGTFLTKFLREISVDDLVKAVDIGINDLGLSYRQSFKVCTGYLKLTGTDLFHLEEDDGWILNGKTYKENMDIDVIEIPDESPFKV